MDCGTVPVNPRSATTTRVFQKSRFLEQTQEAEKASLFCSTILCQNRGMIYGYARVSTGAQDLTSQLAQLKAAGCEKVFREKLTGTTADRPQLQKMITKLASGDVVIIPAVDRLSRDTTDLLIIAREMQKAGTGIRSLAEPFLDMTSDFAEIVFAILASPPSWNAAAPRPHRTGPCRRQRQGRQIRAQAEAHHSPAARSDQTARRGRRNAALDSSQLQCQPA